MVTRKKEPSAVSEIENSGKCVYCQSVLLPKAVYCKECNKFQARYKNWSTPGGVILALVLGIGSGASWFISEMIRDWMSVTEVELLAVSYMPNGSVVIGNVGDNDVLIRSVTFECESLGFRQECILHDQLNASHTLKAPLSSRVLRIAERDVCDLTLADVKLLQKNHRYCVCGFDWRVFDNSYEPNRSLCFPDTPTPLKIPAQAFLKYYSYIDKKDVVIKKDCFLSLTQVATPEGNYVDYLAEVENLRAPEKRSVAKPVVESN